MPDASTRLAAALADRYRIERELGAGGMATVYLAHDLKHDRDVAIKVLHPDLGAALGGERFLSEIRTTARLQHPHILPLLDSGDAGHGLLYYVMPLATGETLRDRLTREKQLPIGDALRISQEVADALGHAHAQGIIHRDIKPENILLQGGHALVADFGIALAVTAAGGARMTQTGLSLGTPQYMSPEQAMGERSIDARSDIYALGAVTYEMLVGDPPFTGSTVQAIVARVLTERPTQPTSVRDTVPRHVEATVLQALAKLPADRFATAAEFAHALQHAGDTAALTAAQPAAAGRARGMRGLLRSPAISWGATALAMAVAAWGWLRGSQSVRTEPPLLAQAHGVRIPNLATMAGVRSFALTRDGQRLVWMGADSGSTIQLLVSNLWGGGARVVPGTEGASSFVVAPDGNSVGVGVRGELLIVPMDGGQPRRLVAATGGSTGVTWTSYGWIVIARRGSVSRIRATGGEPEVIHRDPADSTAIYNSPHQLEESGTLILGRTRNGVPELVAMPIDGGTVTPLGIEATRGVYARGVLVYLGGDGTLHGVPFDPRRLRTMGEPMPIGDAPINSGNARFDLSATGLLVYSAQDASMGELVIVDRAGRERILSDRRGYIFPRFAPSGSPVVVGELTSRVNTREGDLWSIDVASGVKLRVTTDGASSRPSWSPDGQSLVFSRRNANLLQVAARISADGTGKPTTLLERDGGIFELALTADGRTLVWRQDTPGTGTGRDIFAMPVDTPSAARAILQTRFNERGIATGPEGDWIAYVSDESGRDEVYIRRLAAGSPRWAVSRHGGVEPRWTRSGEVFFRNHDSVFVSRVTLGETPRIAEPVPLFAGRYQSLGMESTWDAAPDGKSFVMVRVPEAAEPTVMLYTNWIERWKRQASARTAR